MASPLNVRPTSGDPFPRAKRAPSSKNSLEYNYNASDDGTDENLLILMHGLGDTQLPFSRLGKQLHLPQTATLSVRAPERIPFLDEEAYQWYKSFDNFGEVLPQPNPSRVLEQLEDFLNHLMGECQWPPNRIHLFGFGQGGSIAAELGLRWWKARCTKSADMARLGSIVSVAGPLLSYPTLSTVCMTPILVFHRPTSEASKLASSDLSAFKKGFGSVQEVTGGGGEGMPRSRDEWEPTMRFWSMHLGQRASSGLYEVLGRDVVEST